MNGEGVPHNKQDADQGEKHDVNRAGNDVLHVLPRFLQFLQQLPGALVFKHRVGQMERMLQPVRVEPRADALGDGADKVILKILGHPRDEGHAHRCQQQQPRAAQKNFRRQFPRFRGVTIHNQPKNLRVKQRKHLVHRRQAHGPKKQFGLSPQQCYEHAHNLTAAPERRPAAVLPLTSARTGRAKIVR